MICGYLLLTLNGVRNLCYKKNKPVRLNKIEPNPWIEWLKFMSKQPETYVFIAIFIAMIILVILAIRESVMYFVYNRGL